MKSLRFLFVLLLPIFGFSQNTETVNNLTATAYEGEIFKSDDLQNKPNYGEGLTAFYKFIAQNFRTPDVEGLKGKILLTYVVEIDGSLSDIKVIKDIGYGTGEEAVRVLKLCKKWQPAIKDGKPVRAQYSLPITISTM